MTPVTNRYDFTILFDVINGNPNGDPEDSNKPRTDPETGHGIVTDVCLKRKLRDYVALVKSGDPNYKIYVTDNAILNQAHAAAYVGCGLPVPQNDTDTSKMRKEIALLEALKAWMCQNYYDVRAFGAVMNTGAAPCGTVRGPVQINFARSIDPISIQDVTITRIAVASEDEKGTHTMGRRSVVPYGLYRANGYVSAKLAQSVGFSESDLELFWDALLNMFEHDHSSVRGQMSVQKLVIFKHKGEYGNAPSHKLFDAVTAAKHVDTPRQYSDYTVRVNTDDIPAGVTVIEK